MHRIRYRAQRATEPNYNPFARQRSRRTEADLPTSQGIPLDPTHVEGPPHAESPTHVETPPPSLSRRRKFSLPTHTTEQQESEEQEAVKVKIPVGSQIRSVIRSSWFNILFPLVPAGFTVNYVRCSAPTIFATNFVALIPSSMVYSFALGELEARLGRIHGALLGMTFSNGVQLITSIFLLKERQITVLQISLLGAILSNLLLMTGLSFFLGGVQRLEQYYNPRVSQTISLLLFLAILSVMIPTASHLLMNTSPENIVAQSRGTSIVILISYGLYILFQYVTNEALYRDVTPQETPKAKERPRVVVAEGEAARAVAALGAGLAGASGGVVTGEKLVKTQEEIDKEEEEEQKLKEPKLTVLTGFVVLTISITLLAFNTQFATDNLQGLLEHSGLTQSFVGLVIIPILSNDPLAIKCAMMDNMDESIALTLERCMQTALMVVPSVVIIAWIMGINDMSLEFDGFTTIALFASVVIVSYVVQEGKSNWLQGALLIKVYIIIALAAYYNR